MCEVFYLDKKRNIFDYALDLVMKGYYTEKHKKDRMLFRIIE